MKHHRYRPVSLAIAPTLLISGIAGTGVAKTSPVANATPSVQIEGPISGGERGFPYSASIVDLAPYGYSEQEYFISGRAHSFLPAPGTTLTADGRWSVVAGSDAPYKTRMLVRKPPAAKFNGTVIVEFMQEYFGSERDTNYRWNAETFLRNGFGWVGVSLHHEGIDDPTPPQTVTYGGKTIAMGTTLARWDAKRYGGLTVPSSDLSYDILTQVGRAVGPDHGRNAVDPFAGLKVRKVLAVGNTIAGHRLGIYINAVQPKARVFDGFFLQDFVPSKLQLAKGVETPTGTIRTDTAVPVMILDTTTAASAVGPAPEGAKIRFWHPAGSSHTTGAYMVRVDKGNVRDLGQGGGFCPVGYANELPVQYVSGAAIVALDRWVKTGKAAPSFPQLARFTGPKEPVPQPASYFDSNGNVAGGLRTPWVDVPVARYDWRGECTGGGGRTFDFSKEELRKLYGTPENYRTRFAKSAQDAVRRGVLLPEDAKAAIESAKAVIW